MKKKHLLKDASFSMNFGKTANVTYRKTDVPAKL